MTVALRYSDFDFKQRTVTIKSLKKKGETKYRTLPLSDRLYDTLANYIKDQQQTEAILMGLFLLTGITCKPLFEQGFWTSFNRSFGTLKHLHSEFIASDRLLELTYDCSHLGQQYAGTGYLVKTTPHQAIVYRDGVFLELNRDFKLNSYCS